MVKLVEKVADLPKPLRKPLWRFWHKTMNRYDGKNAAKFLNYGYEKINGDQRLKLKDIDEIDRYCIQLYNHAVENGDLKGKTVLEVGCGRGGGASFISRYCNPESYVGLDITQSSIDFCNQHYKDIKGLSFKCGGFQKMKTAMDFVSKVAQDCEDQWVEGPSFQLQSHDRSSW